MSESSLLTESQIKKRVEELAITLAKEYKNKRPVFVGILVGSYIFMADFTRALWKAGLYTFDVDFIGASSYVDKKTSSRQPLLTKDLSLDIAGRDIVVVEDVVDTGWTFHFLLKHLSSKNPKSLKTLTLLSKPGKREVEVPIDYCGFEIGNEWVIGYGLDGGESGRGLPEIRKVSS